MERTARKRETAMGVSDLHIVSKVPAGAELKEITLTELAKRLGLEPSEVPLLERSIEDTLKNMTVGDVHATTSLSNVSVAYLQGEDDDGEEEGAEEEEDAKKANEEHDEHGRFASGTGGGGGSTADSHLAALMGAGADRGKFETAHAALAGDKSMKVGDLKRVAASFRGGHIHGSGATRADVLGSVRDLFTQHARFQNKIKRDELRLDLAVTKVDPEQRKIFGWASVCSLDGKLIIDKQGDIIYVADLEPAAHDFCLYSRTQGDMHTDIGVGRLIENMVFDQSKREAGIMAKDDKGRVIDGWWVGFLVDDDGVWQAHKDGRRPEFSIGGRARREEA